MNKRAMLVVVANVIMLLYNIDCPVAVEVDHCSKSAMRPHLLVVVIEP